MIKSTASDIFLQSYSNGYGNNLDELEEFEAIYSNNLLDTLSGEAFLTKYDHHNDLVTVIDNKHPCGVKTATRHPIYENFPVKLDVVNFEVAKLKKASLVPVNIFVAQRTRVLVVTGLNTRGKTIIVGLAAMMAKACSLINRMECVQAMKDRIGDLAQSLGMPPECRPFPGDGLGLLKWRMQSKGDGLGLFKWRMQCKGDGLGLFKWRMQCKDASAMPLTSNFLYVSVSMLDDSLILLEVAKMG
ncbi:hypothetical protein Tco_0505006 [Tanacetum coccineum]